MYLSRDEVRAIDRRAIEAYGVSGLILMENAGRGTADLLRSLGIHGPVVICCGKGNNGGDGFVIARHLDNVRVAVRVCLFANPDELSGEALANWQILSRSGIPVHIYATGPVSPEGLSREFGSAEWIVDALFGTGLTGTLRSPFAEIVAAINESKAHVLAADIPSGLDCDTGLPLGPVVRAQHTATFVALKKGFANPAAREWLGQVHVLDIGAPRHLAESEFGSRNPS
jgi:NAD(P)H-hydrate epimerase